MRILIVTAHPSSQGFAHQIARAYQQGAEWAGHQVEILDLYRSPVRQDYLEFEDRRDWSKGEGERTRMQAEIAWADELVFVYPLWWGGPPAILKNWIDQNLTSGFAFRWDKPWYPTALQLLPTRLLKGKQARLFITHDAYKLLYYLLLLPFITIWWLFILKFCGIKLASFKLFGRMRWQGEDRRRRWLEQVKRAAQNTR